MAERWAEYISEARKGIEMIQQGIRFCREFCPSMLKEYEILLQEHLEWERNMKGDHHE